MATTYRIAEVAERSGFSRPTLRYYEEIGLLPHPQRTEKGHRTYDDSTLERLAFIARAKQLGCSLEEISELNKAWDDGLCAPVQSRLQAIVDAKIADTHARIAEMTTLAADLQQAAAVLRSHTPEGPCDDRCGCTTSSDTVAASATPRPVLLTAKPAGAAPEGVLIACTLGPGQMATRIDEWNSLIQGVTNRVALDDGVRLEFASDADAAEIARLAAAEQGCCAFFSFSLVMDSRGTALEVHAPLDGQPVLTALFGAA